MTGAAICRLWRGWATRENADAYERVVRGEVIPGIEARQIPGFRHIDLMRRDRGDDAVDESGTGAQADECPHIGAAPHDRVRAAFEERPTRPEHDRQRQHQFHPALGGHVEPCEPVTKHGQYGDDER